MRVTAVGSCRIYRPLKAAKRQGLCEIHNHGVYGYTHTAKEAIQLLRVLRGEREIPASLQPWIAPHDHETPSPSAGVLSQSDALIVELSSIKQFAYREYALQMNAVKERIGHLPDLWRALNRNKPIPEPREISGLAGPDREIAAEVTMTRQTVASVTDDVRTIIDLSPVPVLFVPHFRTYDENGDPVPSRDQTIANVTAACREAGANLFPLERIYRSMAYRQYAHDTSHWQDWLIPELGAELTVAARMSVAI